MLLIRWAVVVLCVVVVVIAQDVYRELELRAPVRPPLAKDAVEDTLEKRALAVAIQIQHSTSRRDIEAARRELRKQLAESLGYGLLPWPPDLRATVFGTLSRTGYHIEKLGYQTLKDVLVPAHVYVPDGLQTPAPAVLFLGGHWWNEGKAYRDAQAFGIGMARLGFIVMVPDPIGTGERGPAESDHRHPESLLVGLSQPGITEYETKCALEYLRARKDVNPKRIGLTGVDGGGFNTWITAALDDGIAAAVPVGDTFDFADQIHSMRASDWGQAQDQCQLVPGILRYANIHELVALLAPRPLMLIAAPDVRPIYEFGQRVYSSFSEAGHIRLFENSGTAYERPRRHAAYGFFLQALMNRGDGAPIEEQPMETLPPGSPDLACLPAGSRALAGNGIARAIRQIATEAGNAGSKTSPAAVGEPPPQLGKAALDINAFAIHRRNLATEQGIEVPVTILRPGPNHAGGLAGTLLAIDDQDKESLASDPIVQEALQRDYLVVEMDPRGFGELAVPHPGWVFATSLLLGENFVGRQAWDIRLAAIPLVRPGGTRAIYARGPNSSLAAAYAIWLINSRDLVWAVLRGGFSSIRQFQDSPVAASAPPVSNWFLAFGALRSLDLPQLLAATPTKTFLIEPVDVREAREAQSPGVRLATLDEFLGTGW